jgi:hypothetical protein
MQQRMARRATASARYRIDLLKGSQSGVLDRLIDWQWGDVRAVVATGRERGRNGEKIMQRQFTIELRVDYADQEKNEAMRIALLNAARHVFGTAVLLADQVQPTIGVFSDDFFSGHKEIALLDDIIKQGVEDMGGNSGGEQISSELVEAFAATPAAK